MKIVSPFFTAVVAVAVFAYRANADAATACATTCPADGGCTAVQIKAGATEKAILAVPEDAPSCPYVQRYISSLNVSENAGLGIAVTFKQGASGSTITKSQTSKAQDNATPTPGTADCYFAYDDVGKTDTLADDVIATVTCAGGVACNIKYKAAYSCASKVAACPATTDEFLDLPVSSANGADIAPTGDPCSAGQFKYLKSLDVRDGDVVFKNGVTSVAVASGPGCSYYENVKDPRSIPADVVPTVTCKTGTSCTAKYKAVWDCSSPIVYTRTGFATDATGANCVKDLSSCENQCAKSYQLVSTTVDGSTTMAFKSQLTKDGCTCTDVTATVSATGGAGPTAANTATKMNVQVTESDNTMTIAYTDTGKVCKSSYKRVAFENKFAAKNYIRFGVTPATGTTAADCTPTDMTVAAACPYKCANNFALAKPATPKDTITATQVAVSGCTCETATPITAIVDGDGVNAAGIKGTSKYEFVQGTTDVNLKTTTTTGSDPNTKTTVCNAVYKEVCPMLCTDPGCTATSIPVAGTTLTKSSACTDPYSYAYLKGLAVGTDTTTVAVDVKVGGSSLSPVVEQSSGSCFKTYTQFGDTSTLTDNMKPLVTCPGANNANVACSVKINPTWACTTSKCPKQCSDCVPESAPTTTSLKIAKPADKCTTPGTFAYLKSLKVAAGVKDINVVFNNGLKPVPTEYGGSCYFSYTNVIGNKPNSTDVEATITCKDTAGCTISHFEDWGCYTPPTADTYTRVAVEGANCVTDASDCVNRCAKGYMLGKMGADTMFVPQFTTDCNCAPPTATPDPTDASIAKNTAAAMDVKIVNTTAFTISYTGTGKVCKSTYTKTAFENKFVAKTYTRGTTITCDPAANAPAATTCENKCGAELTLTKPSTVVDSINATQTAVTDCSCASIIAVVDGDKAASSTTTPKYEFTATSAGVTLKTTTTSTTTPSVTTTCTATYTEKVTPAPTTAAPPPAATPATTAPATNTKTGTSAGVSALGAGADAGMVTVTLVAAAAGVQAVGLPA